MATWNDRTPDNELQKSQIYTNFKLSKWTSEQTFYFLRLTEQKMFFINTAP